MASNCDEIGQAATPSPYVLKSLGESINLSEEFHDKIITHDFAMLCNIAQHVVPIGMRDGSYTALTPIIHRALEINNIASVSRTAGGWFMEALVFLLTFHARS
jgi:hypothetical protein